MSPEEIRRMRLERHFPESGFEDAVAVVRHFGAMQAQDRAMAQWAVGCRSGSNAVHVAEALDSGKILRTHVLRPTWHLVLPEDFHWMLELTAPHVHRQNASMARKLGIEADTFSRSSDLILGAIDAKGPQTRSELREMLAQNGIETGEVHSILLLMHAELERLICSGPVRDKQQTYELVERRVPKTASLHRDEALRALAMRYFSAHGPATVPDFSWWSGLGLNDCRKAIQLSEDQIFSFQNEAGEYWCCEPLKTATETVSSPDTGLLLLPAFDEYLVGYKDRSDVLDTKFNAEVITKNGIFRPVIVQNGKVTGTWKKVRSKQELSVEVAYFLRKDMAGKRLFREAEKKLQDFND